MPNCSAPLCVNHDKNNPDKVEFYRFPKDEKQRQTWIKNMRCANFNWHPEKRICSWHFPNGKKDGPTRFHWNKDKSFQRLNLLQETKRKRKAIPEPVAPDELVQDECIDHEEELRKFKEHTAATEQALTQKIRELENENYVLQLKVNYLEKKTEELSAPHLCASELEWRIEQLKADLQNTESKPAVTFSDCKLFSSKTLASFTGLQTVSSIDVLVKMYRRKGISYEHTKKVTCLNLEDQVIMFLLKLKLNLPNIVLAKLFKISEKSVAWIFNAILDATVQIFYSAEGPLSRIPMRQINTKFLPKAFTDMPNCRVVIDCTEFTMETSDKLNDKKVTYSNYKSRHTMKCLIGCAPNGIAVYVSDLFGGSESDKSIVLKSEILKQMVPGDMILADKGFHIYDILPTGVALNMPSFLIGRQFTLSETIRNRAYARSRIIVERLNARFKVFRILDCIRSKYRDKAEQIVKSCVALTLLMPTLMGELNERLE